MLGSHTLFIAGCVVLAIGVTLQAGATGAVKATKMSAKLVSGNRRVAGDDSPPEQTVGLEQAQGSMTSVNPDPSSSTVGPNLAVRLSPSPGDAPLPDPARCFIK